MYSDLLDGIKQNYYRGPDGKIIKVFTIEYGGDGKPYSLRASVIKELTPTRDIFQRDISIPFQSFHLLKYHRIPEVEIQESRKENKLEEVCQSL